MDAKNFLNLMVVELECCMLASGKKSFEFKFLFSANSSLKWAIFGLYFENQLLLFKMR